MPQRLGRKRGGRCVVQLQATASWARPEKFYPGDDNGCWMSMMFFTWFTYSSATKLEWKLISWGGKRHTVTTCDNNHWHHLTITFGRSDSWSFQYSQHAPVGSLPQSFPASFCPWPLARQAVSRMTCRLCSQAIERQQSTEDVNNRFVQVYRLRNARNKGNSLSWPRIWDWLAFPTSSPQSLFRQSPQTSDIFGGEGLSMHFLGRSLKTRGIGAVWKSLTQKVFLGNSATGLFAVINCIILLIPVLSLSN